MLIEKAGNLAELGGRFGQGRDSGVDAVVKRRSKCLMEPILFPNIIEQRIGPEILTELTDQQILNIGREVATAGFKKNISRQVFGEIHERYEPDVGMPSRFLDQGVA
jgi:hypothetical protein